MDGPGAEVDLDFPPISVNFAPELPGLWSPNPWEVVGPSRRAGDHQRTVAAREPGITKMPGWNGTSGARRVRRMANPDAGREPGTRITRRQLPAALGLGAWSRKQLTRSSTRDPTLCDPLPVASLVRGLTTS